MKLIKSLTVLIAVAVTPVMANTNNTNSALNTVALEALAQTKQELGSVLENSLNQDLQQEVWALNYSRKAETLVFTKELARNDIPETVLGE